MAYQTNNGYSVLIAILTVIFLDHGQPKLGINVSNSTETDLESWTHVNNNIGHKRDEFTMGWSEWSTWGICSRSCDGGVTYQLRQCVTKTGCSGNSIRYSICNMQPCRDRSDFRATQCKAHNNRPYRGRLYHWIPFYDPEDPCSLTCQASTYLFVAKLAPRVQDGTRCRKGSLDMCVGGKCMPIGCDLKLGSVKKVDDCGICGGDGTTCKRTSYEWVETHLTPCSVTCGRGFQMSRPFCKDMETEEKVSERFCDYTTRPRPRIRSCNTSKCPLKWVVEDWGPCSVRCGNGFQMRNVYCVRNGFNRTSVWVKQGSCFPPKPRTQQPCNNRVCPLWFKGSWSDCSATCGQGHQERAVICRSSEGFLTTECDLSTQPESRRTCVKQLLCTGGKQPDSARSSWIEETQNRPYNQSHLFTISQTNGSFRPRKQPRFTVGNWGPCSASCGEGVKRRSVECTVYLELLKIPSTLPVNKCSGPYPPDRKVCFLQPCTSYRNSPEGIMVINRLEEHTKQKTGERLGNNSEKFGIQTPIFECFRDYDLLRVPPYFCDEDRKPKTSAQTCNYYVCPPRWNLTEFSPCSKRCGGGIQYRQVQCIHHLGQEPRNVKLLQNNLCPQPPPPSQQYCNVIDCPAMWQVGVWSKCSKKCGGGIRTRKVKCIKVIPFGHKVSQPWSRCHVERPLKQKSCGVKSCQKTADKSSSFTPPYIRISKQDYVQEKPHQNVKLDVGGRALLLERTTVKIRCPVQRFNRSLIRWQKGQTFLAANEKYQLSRRGSLKIKNLSSMDTGQYTCRAGPARADIIIVVKPIPFSNSNENVNNEKSNISIKYPQIKVTQQTYVQSYPEEKVNLKIGGYARLYSGSDVKIRCPVYGYDKSMIQWYKGNRRLRQNQKYNISHTGAITIKSLRIEDSGKYSCMVSSVKADMIISVKPTYFTNYPFDRTVERPEIPSESNSDEQEEYSHENRGYGASLAVVDDTNGIFSFRPRVDKPDARPLASLSSDERLYSVLLSLTSSFEPPSSANFSGLSKNLEETSELSTWKLHGGQSSYDEEMLWKTVQEHNLTSSRQTDNHVFPQLQRLLINLSKQLKTSKEDSNRRLLPEDRDQSWSETLNLEWFVTPWSTCSRTCGEKAFQTRSSQCLLKIDDKQHNNPRVVAHKLCINAGLKPPIYIRYCGVPVCPRWEIGVWSKCSNTSCKSLYTGQQERNVSCSFPNGTKVAEDDCSSSEKPIEFRECYNRQCIGVWKAGPWLECNAGCEEVGFKNRVLQCVWLQTERPAENSCKPESKPSIIEHCIGPPCLSGNECIDNSKLCGVVKRLNMCKLVHYLNQCCSSCA
ncbi:ADAMTS-like protein 3 isoform X2 [Limulus polyphemus]|uniref:ADAMTS-like protein 3 isoform X2 n=1 Tax=Limulus polyphemus TaxID=6850 RepID=A0ABM1SSM3_LIMPO|nr:ADAMTS-like protein 3 isoform X2 [Limulus polyphemus]